MSKSRYATATYAIVPHPIEGSVQIAIQPPTLFPAGTVYTEYYGSDADTLDTLAHKQYSDPTRWWAIAAMNPKVPVADEVVPGEILRIPRSVS